MVVHPAVFLDDPEARAIIKTMDGICIESHQFNRYWPLGNEISNPEEIAQGAGHFLQEEKGEELAQVIVKFIADNPVP